MAFALTRTGLTARPLLYGMVLFARMLGPGAQLIRLQLNATRSLRLKAWAVRVNGGTLHLLLLDKGAQTIRARVMVPHARMATVERLTAPSITSNSGVTLDGQRLSRFATWLGKPRNQRLAGSARGFIVAVPRYSAALLTIHLQ